MALFYPAPSGSASDSVPAESGEQPSEGTTEDMDRLGAQAVDDLGGRISASGPP
jgi:hypothetical protein